MKLRDESDFKKLTNIGKTYSKSALMINERPNIRSKRMIAQFCSYRERQQTESKMSNKLKTLSKSQLETLISKSLSDYLNEEVNCKVHHTDIPNIDDEDNIEHNNKRTMSFRADLSYEETDRV